MTQTIHSEHDAAPIDDFNQLLDQVDPMACPQGELESLLNAAPNDYFKGFLTGIFEIRQQLAILTLLPF